MTMFPARRAPHATPELPASTMVDCGPRKSSKRDSEQRKEQNRRAQRAYKARQKQRLQTLQNAVDAHGLATPAADGGPRSPLLQHTLDPSGGCDEPDAVVRVLLSQAVPTQHRNSDRGLSDEFDRDLARLRNALLAGLEAASPAFRRSLSWLPDSQNQDYAQHSRYDLQKIIMLNAARQWQSQLPGQIRVVQMSTVAAVRMNAEMLGLEFTEFCGDETESPFFGQPPHRWTDLPPDMLPETSQLQQSHHPFLDTLPFPTFRHKFLSCLATTPNLFEEGDFCKDMHDDGLVCWGSRSDSDANGYGSGTPWESRSWEAKPWFIEKWWFLLDGPQDPIVQSTKWWCHLRGETLQLPECIPP